RLRAEHVGAEAAEPDDARCPAVAMAHRDALAPDAGEIRLARCRGHRPPPSLSIFRHTFLRHTLQKMQVRASRMFARPVILSRSYGNDVRRTRAEPASAALISVPSHQRFE